MKVLNVKVTQKHCSAESDLQVVSPLHTLNQAPVCLHCKNRME